MGEGEVELWVVVEVTTTGEVFGGEDWLAGVLASPGELSGDEEAWGGLGGIEDVPIEDLVKDEKGGGGFDELVEGSRDRHTASGW